MAYYTYTSFTHQLKWEAMLDLFCHSIVDTSGPSTQIVAAVYGATIWNLSEFVPWH